MRRTVQGFRSAASELAVELRGLLRRVSVARSSGGLWQLLGYEGGDGERESFNDVPMFQGVGFFSRPRAGQGEAVIGHIGGRNGHAVGVASRDASIIPDDVAEDETGFCNSKAVVKADADGNISAVPDAAAKVLLGSTVAAQAAVRGTLYRAAEDSFLDVLILQLPVLSTALTSLGQSAAATAVTAIVTAATAFKGGGPAYLSTNVNVK